MGPQFSWIEANLLGFFLVDVRNSRGKFDEILIIMLKWMRLYTLGSRGSPELKTFLEIRLISSRIDEKLKNKGKISPKSWAIEAVVGAVLRGRGSDSFGRLRSSRIRGEFFLKLASK